MSDTAALNASLFNTLANIYSQMGQPPPPRPASASGGGGAYTTWLNNAIAEGNRALANYQNEKALADLRAQMQTAQKAMQSRLQALTKKATSQPRVLQSSLSQTDSGVQGRRSSSQQRALEEGVRASNQLQSGPYMTPGGGTSSKPFGSSINLA